VPGGQADEYRAADCSWVPVSPTFWVLEENVKMWCIIGCDFSNLLERHCFVIFLFFIFK
jgi:hypothetical protein